MTTKPGSGSSLEQWRLRLAGMSVDDLARMVFVSNVLDRGFQGQWDGIPNVTVKELIGSIMDECGERKVG